MQSVRLWVWLLSALVSILISKQTHLIFHLSQLLDFLSVPQWIYLLPISLTLAWGIAQVCFIWLNTLKIPSRGKAVFITGCDSGFGHHLALRLRDRGFLVFAGCLFPQGEGASRLIKSSQKTRGDGAILVVPCDVTSEDSLKEAVNFVSTNLRGKALWAVVANAGILTSGYVEWASMSKLQRMFDVNVFGVMRTIRAFVPFLRTSKGRVVVTTSWAAHFAAPNLVSYAMTKHAVLALCNGLRAELLPFGIEVSSIEPNMYKTSIIPPSSDELDELWASLTDEQQTAYGDALLKKSHQMLKDFAHLCESDLTFPINTFEHAIVSRFPKPSYQSDRLSMLILSKIVLFLPEQFNDFLLQNVNRLLSLGRLLHN
ncbi:short-chain dehydrogenase/reductase family 9C member 7 [Galendromus occidentalis]|uniref:Short-chain dehydrogenase/reductase family 9C member 7 n=1 Tax=Galendromus occidentalis TaxID=34638 RepID=A0AAJ6QQN8_9ACAR|nr:short-chain dehydrogenase/reductase family 9C member 7 [Galendromus occidentalis]